MEDLTSDVNKLDPKSREFADVLKTSAEKISELRRKEGEVPYEVYMATMEMAGLSPALEVLVFDKEGNLYLKRRKPDENVTEAEKNAWEGKLHIPGTTVFPAKRFELNFYDLLNREIVGSSDDEKRKRVAKLYRGSETMGVAVTPVPERKTTGLTILMKVVVEDPGQLQDGFEKVSTENTRDIIDQHKLTVSKALQNKPGPLIFDESKSQRNSNK